MGPISKGYDSFNLVFDCLQFFSSVVHLLGVDCYFVFYGADSTCFGSLILVFDCLTVYSSTYYRQEVRGPFLVRVLWHRFQGGLAYSAKFLIALGYSVPSIPAIRSILTSSFLKDSFFLIINMNRSCNHSRFICKNFRF